ncbi:hypothetical protein R5R35_012983 [Gryllus longicercus]|uniref:Uncharacterized protein n=1 Tax=Gryllus longicercus TaxID=2509291 RepID=A0AAN9YUG1_9ORTH
MGCPRRLALLLVVLLALHAQVGVDARYLPTRAQDDRLDRLRELIRDLLENEVDKYNNANVPADLFGPGDRAGFVFKQRQMPGRVMLADEDRK